MTADARQLEAFIEELRAEAKAVPAGEYGTWESDIRKTRRETLHYCAKRLAALVRAGGVERTPEEVMSSESNDAMHLRGVHSSLVPGASDETGEQHPVTNTARGAVEPPPPEVHADLYQDCGHWKCNDVANRHPELRNVAVEPPAQEPSEQEIAKAAVAFWDELPDDTISGQKSLTDGFTAGVRWLLRRSASPSEQAACDHKFVDSNSCLKCGWMPPSAPHGADTPEQAKP